MTKCALISVSDKNGIVEFAKKLDSFGWEIISTGGTKVTLDQAVFPRLPLMHVTGFPEMMDGRVKTLHPKIHGGLLARRDLDSHLEAASDHEIDRLIWVVVNLYPFKETILRPDVTYDLAVENIDIGGPSMLRSAGQESCQCDSCGRPGRLSNSFRRNSRAGKLATNASAISSEGLSSYRSLRRS